MKPDPIDELATRLFDAARTESPAQGAEQRVLTAALRARELQTSAFPRAAVWGVAVTAVLLAASVALLVRQQKHTESISAEPARARSAEPKAPAAAESAPTASVRLEPRPAPSVVRAPLSSAVPPAASAATLTDELDALKVASSALSAGDAAAALSALDHYDRVLKGSKLRAEATMLRIQALARSGNAPAASALAQRFVAQNPESPLVDRARSFIQTTDLGGN